MKKMIKLESVVETKENVITMNFITDSNEKISMKVMKVCETWEVIEAENAKNNLANTYVGMITDMIVSAVERIKIETLFRDSDMGPKLLSAF